MMQFPPYTTALQRAGHWALWLGCGAILVFLIAPVLVVIPLAFNNEPYFNFPVHVYSLRWFRELFGNPVWLSAIANSVITVTLATVIATTLGTLAAVGLNHRNLPGKRLIMALLVSPMIVPVVVLAVGAYFFFSRLGIANNLLGIVLVHAALGVPFVVITVSATLAGFDIGLLRAARGLGASPLTAFRRVMLPLVWPGCCRARCLLSPPPSTRWWWCCSWVARDRPPCRARCGPGCVSSSRRPSWRRPSC